DRFLYLRLCRRREGEDQLLAHLDPFEFLHQRAVGADGFLGDVEVLENYLTGDGYAEDALARLEGVRLPEIETNCVETLGFGLLRFCLNRQRRQAHLSERSRPESWSDRQRRKGLGERFAGIGGLGVEAPGDGNRCQPFDT